VSPLRPTSGKLSGLLVERLVELRATPAVRGTLAGAALTAAGIALRRPREGILAGLAAGIGVGTGVRVTAKIERAAHNCEDAATLAPRLDPHLSALGGWAIDADFARLIVRELESAPKTVVELGSGLSTVLIASILAERDSGRLISIDHDPRFSAGAGRRLQFAGGSDKVDLVVAPLLNQTFKSIATDWYDAAALTRALPDDPIELLIVDGPPSTSEWTRWPAIEVLAPYLAPGAVVLLDDGRRREERVAALRWAREHRLKLWWLDTEKGAWRLEKHEYEAAPFAVRAVRRAFRTLNPSPPIGFGRSPVER
jgi:predicted O-methyltransferase YrrM